MVSCLVCAPMWISKLNIAIKIDDPGPIFFRQKRIGNDKDGEIRYFHILKYRSMKTSTPKDTPTHLLENPEQYITKVGGFLRKTSLDELPQIFNIFRGEMSIIGERGIIEATKIFQGLSWLIQFRYKVLCGGMKRRMKDFETIKMAS